MIGDLYPVKETLQKYNIFSEKVLYFVITQPPEKRISNYSPQQGLPRKDFGRFS